MAIRTDIGFPFRGDGLRFPVPATPPDLFLEMIEQIVFVALGERVMRPSFGSTIYTFLFRPVNDGIAALLADRVKKDIQRSSDGDIIITSAVGTALPDERAYRLDLEYVSDNGTPLNYTVLIPVQEE